MELSFCFVYWCLAAMTHRGGPYVQTHIFLCFLFTQIYTFIFTVNFFFFFKLSDEKNLSDIKKIFKKKLFASLTRKLDFFLLRLC